MVFDRMFPGALAYQASGASDARLLAINLAFSIQVSQASDLPVDFQFQRLTEANMEYGDRPRSALGVRCWGGKQLDGAT